VAAALIIVDVQNDFITGSLAVPGGERVAYRIAKLCDSTEHSNSIDVLKGREDYTYIVSTQDWHVAPGTHWAAKPDYEDTWPEHCRAGTWGAELHPALSAVDFDAQFHKGHYNAAYSGFEGHLVTDGDSTTASQGLASWLREHGVTKVAVCGLATDYCVAATAADANAAGFKTMVLLPASAAINEELARKTLATLQEAGVGVLV
jgi:nicotinamidase/pyrazinamidase